MQVFKVRKINIQQLFARKIFTTTDSNDILSSYHKISSITQNIGIRKKIGKK